MDKFEDLYLGFTEGYNPQSVRKAFMHIKECFEAGTLPPKELRDFFNDSVSDWNSKASEAEAKPLGLSTEQQGALMATCFNVSKPRGGQLKDREHFEKACIIYDMINKEGLSQEASFAKFVERYPDAVKSQGSTEGIRKIWRAKKAEVEAVYAAEAENLMLNEVP